MGCLVPVQEWMRDGGTAGLLVRRQRPRRRALLIRQRMKRVVASRLRPPRVLSAPFLLVVPSLWRVRLRCQGACTRKEEARQPFPRRHLMSKKTTRRTPQQGGWMYLGDGRWTSVGAATKTPLQPLFLLVLRPPRRRRQGEMTRVPTAVSRVMWIGKTGRDAVAESFPRLTPRAVRHQLFVSSCLRPLLLRVVGSLG